ncbi:MAG: hypothetical protein RI933_637 [Actinomycetota bacterium]|jgi:MFS family permease|uniref:MFS transporter n=1 Tax=Candidatus Rhodoluna planktonica TaxID=535712 RepID=A0A1D9DY72_9MICO|nr:MFS transporter [Candidatus Rhodoluna planktonica]AOY55756.1 hypothetical protein A4Z71_01770 [Candidatus Rhodoluna planktonica]
MSSYSELLRQKGFGRIILSQLLARFPFGMMTIAFVLHIEQMHDSYAVAGLALGAETIGAAISGPLLARWMGPFGARRVILTGAITGAIAMLIIAIFWLPTVLVIFLSLIVGLTSPPIQSAARTIYPSLVSKKQLNSVYAMDATAQEIIWVIGPVTAALLASSFGSAAVVALMAVLQIFGSILFSANREVAQLKIPAPNARVGGILRNRLVLSNAIIGLLMVGSFSGVEVGAVAILDKGTAGLVLAAFSAGSLLGGIFLGNRAKTDWALTKFLAVILLGYSLFWFAPENPWWIGICMFVSGLGVAPAFGLLAALVAKRLKQADAAEAYGWINTGQLMGYSAGAALSGIAIDIISSTAALWVSIIFGAATVVAAALTTKSLNQKPKD